MTRSALAQAAAEIPPRRADGVAPGCMQRSADANELFVFDEVARRAAVRWVSNKSRSYSERRGAARPLQPRVYARTRPQRQGRLIHRRSGPARVTLPISKSSSDKAMAFQFVHTADVHLDSPLATLALRDPELAELIGGATRKAFVAVIDLCLVEAGRRAPDRRRPLRRRTDVDEDGALSRRPAEKARRGGRQDLHHSRQSRRRVAHHQGIDPARIGQGVRRAGGSRVARPRRARGDGAWGELRAQARAREPVAEVPAARSRKRQYRHAAHEPRRLARAWPLRAMRACRSPWRRLRLLGARPHSSAVRGAGQGGDRDAGQSARARHQRGRPEVGDAGHDRRRPQDHDRRAADERRAVRARSRRSCRRRRLAGGAGADREGASRRARRGAERASGRAAYACGRDAARLAAALGRRRAGGRIPHALGAAIGKTWIDKIELDCVAPRANESAPLERSGRRTARADGDRGRAVEGVSGRACARSPRN